METSTYTTTVLMAQPGMWITNAKPLPTEEQAWGQTVYLAANDSPDNWREATDEEHQHYLADLDQLKKEKEAAAAITRP